MTARKLPTIEKWGETYYIDHRLGELRNMENPWDVVNIDNCPDEEEFFNIMMDAVSIEKHEDTELNKWG